MRKLYQNIDRLSNVIKRWLPAPLGGDGYLHSDRETVKSRGCQNRKILGTQFLTKLLTKPKNQPEK
jgi:hypothetical protein